MDTVCNTYIKDPSFYFSMKPTRVYVCDLSHQAPGFIKKAREYGAKVYGAAGNRGKGLWIAVLATGSISPKTYWIKLSNGVEIIDYSGFDTCKDFVDEEEMMRVIRCAHQFEPSLGWSTANRMIERKLDGFLELQCQLTDIERENYDFLDVALRGGANCVLMNQQLIEKETHIDFHQLYASVMKTKSFPCGEPTYVEGFEDHEFAIYAIQPGTMARVKKNGYPIIPIGRDTTGMAGADGEWFDAGETIQFISRPDLELFFENYELADKINIVGTLYYQDSFAGSDFFGSTIDEIYNQRLKYKGQPEERFYKILNEVMPGHFERRTYHGGFWKKDFSPNENHKVTSYNPKVGIFITAYARQKLNWLLHQFNHNKVIGYDTDCVFFAGTMEELPWTVANELGKEPGKLHEDGIYKNVYHKASKSYWGTNAVTDEPFTKIAGTSKSGKAWYWNYELKEYELKEVIKDD